MSKQLKKDNHITDKISYHADFAVCLTCPPCGTSCSFLSNTVVFVKSKTKKHISSLEFDRSLSICNNDCKSDCISHFSLIKILENKL